MARGRARHVPVNRVTHGDSRSFTGLPAVHLTCAAAGPAVAATSFASRGSGVRVPQLHPGQAHIAILKWRSRQANTARKYSSHRVKLIEAGGLDPAATRQVRAPARKPGRTSNTGKRGAAPVDLVAYQAWLCPPGSACVRGWALRRR